MPNRMYFRDDRGIKITLATQDNQYGITVGVAITHPEDCGSKEDGYAVALVRLASTKFPARTLSRERFFDMVTELRLAERDLHLVSYSRMHRLYLRILNHYRVI